MSDIVSIGKRSHNCTKCSCYIEDGNYYFDNNDNIVCQTCFNSIEDERLIDDTNLESKCSNCSIE